jgi:hypothetical protein
MKKLPWILIVSFLLAACTAPEAPKEAAPAASAAPAAKPYANLAQLMRTLPFPNSNIIFDTQSNDPEEKKKAAQKAGPAAGATDQYGALYGGWEGVEASALALSETANLILIPGRKCMNGKDVPLNQENFKKWAQGLADAGMKAYEAAKSKNMDMMVEVSGTVSDACLACHEVYRDQPAGKERCTP